MDEAIGERLLRLYGPLLRQQTLALGDARAAMANGRLLGVLVTVSVLGVGVLSIPHLSGAFAFGLTDVALEWGKLITRVGIGAYGLLVTLTAVMIANSFRMAWRRISQHRAALERTVQRVSVLADQQNQQADEALVVLGLHLAAAEAQLKQLPPKPNGSTRP